MRKVLLLPLLLMVTFLNAQTGLEFDSNNSTESVYVQNMTPPQTEFTFEAWVNFKGQDDSFPTIIEFGDDAPWLGLDEDGRDTSQYHLTLYDIVYSPDYFPTNKLTHVAATYTSTEAKLYIDGVLVATEVHEDFGLEELDLSGVGMGIGYSSIGDDAVFNGIIDEVRIWEDVRTADEIAENMNVCLTGNEQGLYAYYKFDEGTGTIANDSSPNNFDGTLIDMEEADWVENDVCTAATASINDFKNDGIIRIYPNPTVATFNIDLSVNQTVDVAVFNIFGQQVYLKKYTEKNEITLNLDLASGMYYIQVTNESGKSTIQKLLIE